MDRILDFRVNIMTAYLVSYGRFGKLEKRFGEEFFSLLGSGLSRTRVAMNSETQAVFAPRIFGLSTLD